MPKVLIQSSSDFEVSVIDEEAETIVLETKKISRSIDGQIPILLIESDSTVDTVVSVSDSIYSRILNGTGDEEMPNYTTRKDFIGDNIIITGEAAVGSSESDPVWRIYKLEFLNSDGDIKETWANNSDAFDKVWIDRLTYSF